MKTQRKAGCVWTGAETGLMLSKAKEDLAYKKLEKARMDPPLKAL